MGRETAKIWPDKLKGFLDNNANIWGKEIEGIQVLKLEDVITDDSNVLKCKKNLMERGVICKGECIN